MNKEKRDAYLLQTILFSLIAAGIIFGYFILKGKGFFVVVDDFNEQQLTFATAVWNMIHSGNIGEWSWNIDLGSSFINTFSFYDLGSPFIWISFLAPGGVFPYLAGVLYIIKYVIAAVAAYLYLKLYVKKHQWCVVGALLYAFSGYQTTNLEFYHFHDVVALFPFLLWGLELAMQDKKHRPVFIFTIFINCLLNYFFFVGEVIFLIIYYVVRYRKKTAQEFASGIFSCIACGILGVGMAAILFFPSILYVLGNSRGQSKFYLENVAYDSSGLLHIIKGFLFPGEAMRELSAVKTQNWQSTSAYVPFFGISMVMAYLKREKKNWLYYLLWILGGISLFPLSESLFLLFSEATQRWWYMFVLVMVLATTIVLEDIEDYPVVKSSLLYGGMLTIFYIMIRFMKWSVDGDKAVYNSKRFLLFYLIALIGPSIFILLKKKKMFSYKNILILTMCCCVVTTGITLHFYRSGNSDVEDYKERFYTGLQLKTLDEQYRYNSTDNVLMINGNASGIGVFCTTIENSSRKFETLFEHYSSNSTQNKYDVPGLPELLAGKYVIVRDGDRKEAVDSITGRDKTYYVVEQNACPIGFAVDYTLTEDELLEIPKEQRALTLMRAAIVGKSELTEFENIAPHVENGDIDYGQSIDSFIEGTVENRVLEFQRDSHGFKCITDYEKDRLLYFTVPWSKGWVATVDGKSANVIDSGGMMALSIPAGEHQVVFTYHTPGFHIGVLISLVSFCIFIVICFIQFIIKKNKEEFKK